jgi:hypothetical protein
MPARGVRRVVIAVCALGIAGLIAASIAGSTGGAVTAGMTTAVGALVLISITATAGAGAFGPVPVDETAAADVERRVQSLVASGADEHEVRSLVRAAQRIRA